MNKKLILSFFVCLLLVSLTSAAITSVVAPAQGCTIEGLSRDTIMQNRGFDFNFHVFNTSNGYPLSNTTLTCNFHLYNQSGDHIYGSDISNDPVSEHGVINEWAFRSPPSYYTQRGIYAFVVQCNGTTSVGGCSDKGNFLVTMTGNNAIDGVALIGFILAFILIFGYIMITFGLNLEGLAKMETDIRDMMQSFIGFIALFFYYYCATIWYPDAFILSTCNWLLWIAGFTHLLIPILSFVLSITIGQLRKME